jgi:uncharacterized glyoxalase superfamily protein PhnB
MNIKKITSVLFVDEIEPCLELWIDRLGFQKVMDVPDGPKLGFAILTSGDVEVMYQTFHSREQDVAGLEQVNRGPTFLYVEVDDLNGVMAAVSGYEVFLPLRTTFYGATEFGIKDPWGHVIVFAEMSTES